MQMTSTKKLTPVTSVGNKTGSGPIAKSPSTSVMRTLPNMSMFGGGDTTILKHLDLNTKKKYNYIPSTKIC